MKTILLLICAIFIVANAVADDSATEARLAEVKTELRALLIEARNAPATLALERRVEAARSALEQAQRETPGVAELDAKMVETRQTLQTLQREKNARLRANAAVLDAKRAELEAVESAYIKARRGGDDVEQLLSERNALWRAMAPTGTADVVLSPEAVTNE